MRGRGFNRTFFVFFLLAACCVPSEAAPQSVPPPKLPVLKAAAFGEPFPVGAHRNLNAGPGGDVRVDLRETVGKTPIVMCYFGIGDPRSVAVLKELQDLVEKIGRSHVALYGVTALTGTMDEGKARERIAEMKLSIPVLFDEGPRIAFQLAVLRLPSIAIVDKEGRLRLANGGSLKQILEYKMDLSDAIRRVAETGRLGTYGMLPSYYPAVELVGAKCPDFEAPVVGEEGTRSLFSFFAPDKVNVLVFWSHDCPHCRKSLPAIETWFREHPEGMNILTAVQVTSEANRIKTEEYLKREKLTLPTFLDQDFKIGRKYLVSSTPTIFIIRPDGVIDSVLFSGEMDYGAAFDSKKKQILKS